MVSPKDSASLILIRPCAITHGPSDYEVLVGRRTRANRFLPGIFAFPGGRLDRQDRRQSGFNETFQAPAESVDRETRYHFGAFVRAALRETHEETGLLIGRQSASASLPSPTGHWNAFWDRGLVPAFDAPRLVARAITPTGSPIRFHNRFLLCDGRLAHGAIGGSGELDEVDWVPLKDAMTLPMGEIGTLALAQAVKHLEAVEPLPITRFSWKGPNFRPAFGQDGP
ncbi:MAG: NUDIX domain-containing protein [Pseudomonadota bacterium]